MSTKWRRVVDRSISFANKPIEGQMSSCKEEQEEEADVLLSIYEGDQLFKQVNATTYHYRFGEESSPRGFVAEICWTDEYPNAVPQINLELFGNRHLIKDVRETIRDRLLEQAEMNIGMPMTYTLFEWLKENAEELTEAQPISRKPAVAEDGADSPSTSGCPGGGAGGRAASREPKREKLTKAQKRKLASRVINGQLPRGHDWVDVIGHLMQSGSAG